MHYALLTGLSTLLALSTTSIAAAVPASWIVRTESTLTTILQFSLSIEHLQNEFYTAMLGKFDEPAFKAAGYQPWVRRRFTEIGEHEMQHVHYLTTALGDKAFAACDYDFDMVKSVSDFVKVAQYLEGVGVSAYVGALQHLQSQPFLTAAGSMLAVEARHTAWIGSAVEQGSAWPSSMDTPQDPQEVYTMLSPYIKSCPASNPILPVQSAPFPRLSVSHSTAHGRSVKLEYDGTSEGVYLAVFSGLTTTYLPVSGKHATLPEGMQGLFWVVVTKSGTSTADDQVVAGPTLFSTESRMEHGAE